MVEGVGDEAVAAGLCTRAEWERGVAALRRAASGGGAFCYTFFKAVAVRGG